MQTNTELVGSTFGFYNYDPAIDLLYDEFGQDLTDGIIIDTLSDGCEPRDLRNWVVSAMWEIVVSEMTEKYDIDYELFDSYINGNLDTHFYFNNIEIDTCEQLEELIESYKAEDNED